MTRKRPSDPVLRDLLLTLLLILGTFLLFTCFDREHVRGLDRDYAPASSEPQAAGSPTSSVPANGREAIDPPSPRVERDSLVMSDRVRSAREENTQEHRNRELQYRELQNREIERYGQIERERLALLTPPSITEPVRTSTYVRVEVLYGTDRSRIAGFPVSYSSDRSTLQFGTTFVSIPAAHRPGELESPAWYHFEFQNDPEKHITLLEVTPLTLQGWRTRFRQSLNQSNRKEALVFVHGYNVTFEEAARRTAQLAYDLGIDGVPVMYSWPSKGEIRDYMADEASADAAIPRFRQFVNEVTALTGIQKVHILAHSMGSRIVTNALRAMAPEARANRFNEVILAAPDIDAQVFAEQILPAIRPMAHRISLYASSHDNALKASQTAHAFRRAGQSGDDIIVLDGLETIDASRVDTDLLGHGYFAENKEVIDDIFLVLRHDLPPDERNLRRQFKGRHLYWLLQ